MEGYAQNSSHYEKGRPMYPSSVIQKTLHHIFDGTTSLELSVVDLAAGTGKWTSTLVDYFQDSEKQVLIHAIEPSENFHGVLHSKFATNPRVVVHDGAANDLTSLFNSKSLDAIFIATAFHWFATQEVLEQLYQVLRDNAWVCMIWNVQVYDIDKNVRHHYQLDVRNEEFLRSLKREVVNLYHDEHSPDVVKTSYRAMKGDILKLVNDFGKFGSSNDYQSFHNSMQQVGNVERVIHRVLSISSFGRRSDAEQQMVRQRIQELVKEYFGDLDYDKICLPYRTDVLMLQKR